MTITNLKLYEFSYDGKTAYILASKENTIVKGVCIKFKGHDQFGDEGKYCDYWNEDFKLSSEQITIDSDKFKFVDNKLLFQTEGTCYTLDLINKTIDTNLAKYHKLKKLNENSRRPIIKNS